MTCPWPRPAGTLYRWLHAQHHTDTAKEHGHLVAHETYEVSLVEAISILGAHRDLAENSPRLPEISRGKARASVLGSCLHQTSPSHHTTTRPKVPSGSYLIGFELIGLLYNYTLFDIALLVSWAPNRHRSGKSRDSSTTHPRGTTP